MDGRNDNVQDGRAESLAREVIILSRNTLLVNLRFLDRALSMFKYVPYSGTFATDGRFMCFDAKHILRRYRLQRECVVRDYLHVVMHCIFRHMYGRPDVDRAVWDLACDIAVEYSINGLGLKSVETPLSARQSGIFEKLKKNVKFMTAEHIYRYLKDENMSADSMSKMRSSFYSDDHEMWYMSDREKAALGLPVQVRGDDSDSKNGDGKNGDGDDSSDKNGQSDGGSAPGGRSMTEQEWKDISEHIQEDLESFSKRQGDKAGGLMQNLKEVNREKYDYTSFLKKFAVTGEVMKINDDEFDYVYYTYGLKLYDKMPLIEPLEYKDVKRIREFVIAIDTSGSVSGEQVQTFLQKTYNILKSTESFFSKINIHIIQCDAEIQEHVRISSQDEFDRYIGSMKIRGLGGTDFRPVFSLTDKLIEQKEFINLRGLIYFTDGFGTFPEKMPDYSTAFVFIDDEYNNYDVPPWAIKLILQKEDI